MGANSQGGCANPDVYNPAITEDPTVGITMNAAGRATYISSVNNLATSTRILNGPRLSVVAAGAGRRTDNGWILNIIFCVTPQFYATGITTSTITFTISAGPNLAC
jgi:hypothetical protein